MSALSTSICRGFEDVPNQNCSIGWEQSMRAYLAASITNSNFYFTNAGMRKGMKCTGCLAWQSTCQMYCNGSLGWADGCHI